jgi:hypothetical protein
MRRTLLAAVLPLGIVALAAPAPTNADTLSNYSILATANISPPPLVPTDVPPIFVPLDDTLRLQRPPRRRGGYALSLFHYGPVAVDASIYLDAGFFPTLRAAVRNVRKRGYKARSTRVRGQRGYLLTKRRGAKWSFLVWVDQGLVYTIQTTTPRKVSATQLRAVAEALDPVERPYIGSFAAADTDSDANLVTTPNTVTGEVNWTAVCQPSAVQTAGAARVTVVRRQGNDFAFDIAPNQYETTGWSGTVSGTVAPEAITLNLRAVREREGSTCDTGPVTYRLEQRER